MMEKSLSDLGIEYAFYIKDFLVVDDVLVSFTYSIIMSYEDMRPGVCSEIKTYQFNSSVPYRSNLTFDDILKYVYEQDSCDDLEKTTIFKEAYETLLLKSRTKVVRCGGPEWSISRTL